MGGIRFLYTLSRYHLLLDHLNDVLVMHFMSKPHSLRRKLTARSLWGKNFIIEFVFYMNYGLRPLTQTRAYLKTSGRVLWIA